MSKYPELQLYINGQPDGSVDISEWDGDDNDNSFDFTIGAWDFIEPPLVIFSTVPLTKSGSGRGHYHQMK